MLRQGKMKSLGRREGSNDKEFSDAQKSYYESKYEGIKIKKFFEIKN